jgi:hypothetical protein
MSLVVVRLNAPVESVVERVRKRVLERQGGSGIKGLAWWVLAPFNCSVVVLMPSVYLRLRSAFWGVDAPHPSVMTACSG